MATTTEGLVFTNRNQSLYDSNVTETNNVSVRFEQPWDIDAVDYRVDLTQIEIIPEIPIYIFGELVAVTPALTIDLETQFEFFFDTSGKVGIEFGASVDRGSINSEVIYEPSLTYADNLRYGDGVLTQALSFESGSGAALAGSFDTNPFGISAYMDFLYRLGFQFDLGLRLFGKNIIPISRPPLDVEVPVDVPLLPQQRNPNDLNEIEGTWRLVNFSNTNVELIEFVFADLIIDGLVNEFGSQFFVEQFLEQVIGVEQGIGDTYYAKVFDILDALAVTITVDPYSDKFEVVLGSNPIRSKDNKLSDSQGLLTYDLGSINFNIPTPLPTDNTLENGVLAGSDSDLILAPRFDLDGIAAYAVTKATGYPIATEYNLYLGEMFQINISLLDIDVGPDLRWRQDLELRPNDLLVTYAFTDLNGNEAFVRVQDATGTVQSVSSWTGPLEALPALALEGPVIATPTYQTAASLNNKTGFELGFGLDFLIGQLGLIVRDEKTKVKVVNEQLGPLFEISVTDQDFFPNNDLFFPVIDQTGIQIGGYNTIQGTPILLDVEGSPTPGLSGFVNDRNLFDPVAVTDDGFTVDKSGRLVFEPGALLQNDYDPDAFDTLRITRVGNLEGEGSGLGTVTLRDDGSIVFDTAGMFDDLSARLVDGEDFISLEADSRQITFEYEVVDAVGHAAQAKVVIDVLGSNTRPVTGDDFFSVTLPSQPEDVRFPTESLLANDVDPDSPGPSPLGDPLLRISGVFGQSTALGGTVRIGEVDFEYLTLPPATASLAPGQVLFDSFTYEIRDNAMFDNEPGVTGTVNVAFVNPGANPSQALWSHTPAVTAEAGATAVPVTFLLGTVISGPVTVEVSAPVDTGITIIGQILNFTPETANIPQTVMVEGTISTTEPITVIGQIVSAPNDPGLLGEQVSVEVAVAEPPAIVAESTLTQNEGPDSATTMVTLSRAPATDTLVVLEVFVADPASAANVVPASLTFTPENWQSGLPITVTPVDDSLASGARIVDLTLSVDGGATTDPDFARAPDTAIAVTILDDENAAPFANFDVATVVEDGTVTIDAAANDTDADGDLLTLLSVTAQNGTAEIIAGAISYTPNADFFGTDVLQYTITDGAASSTAPIEVTVTPVDDVPLTMPGFIGGVEDTPITVDLATFVEDRDGDALTFSVATEAGAPKSGNGLAQIDGSILTFTPDADFFNAEALRDVTGALQLDAEGEAIYRFSDPVSPAFVSWTVSDGTTELEQTAVFAIAPRNDAPVLPDQITIDADEDTPRVIDLASEVLALAVDPEGAPLSISRVETAQASADAPQPFFYDPELETVTFDPADSYAALDVGETATVSFSYTVQDELGASSEGHVDVEVSGRNDAPSPQGDGFVLRLPFDGASIPLGNMVANDTDPEGDPLTWRFGENAAVTDTEGQSKLGATLTRGPDGVATYLPSPQVLQSIGPFDILFDTFDYIPSDDNGAETELGGSVTVVLLGEEVPAGLILSTIQMEIQEGALDGVFQVGLTEAPTQPITVNLSSFAPDQAYPGQDSLVFTPDDWVPKSVRIHATADSIEDGRQTTFIEVSIAPNTDPTFSNPAFSPQFLTVGVEDRGPGILTSKSHVSVSEGGDGATIAVWLTSQPDGPVSVRADFADSANFTVIPAQLTFLPGQYNERQYVTIFPVDDDVLDGVGLDIIRFEVDPEATDASYLAADAATVLAIVEDNETVPFPESYGLPPLVRVAATQSGQLEGDTTNTTVEFLLTREGDLSETSVVDWAVGGVGGVYAADANDFVGGAFPTGRATFGPDVASLPIEIAVAADLEEELDEWFGLSMTAVENARVLSHAAESSIRNDDGLSGALPDRELSIFLASDEVAEGGTLTAEIRRDDPTIGAETFVLSSTDPDRVTVPSEITIENGASATFTISVTDNALRDGDAFVVISAVYPDGGLYRAGGATLKVLDDEANRAPIAFDDIFTTDNVTRSDPDAMVQLDLTQNDTDPDGDTVSVVSLDLEGFRGQLFEGFDGRFAYNPNGAFDGLAENETAFDTFRYSIADESGLTDEGVVTISVIGTVENLAPVAGDDAFTIELDEVLSATVTENDTDPEGAALVYNLVTGAGSGVVDLLNDGSFTYVPNGGFIGTDSFVYSASDGTNLVEATVSISVGENQPPANVAIVTAPTSQHQTLDAAISVALAGQVIEVLDPVEVGAVGDVIIAKEGLTLRGDDPFDGRFTLDIGIMDLTLEGTTEADVTGNDADNGLTGSAGDNRLLGGIGDDTLFGGIGDDTLFGGLDDDSLFGGADNDRIYGGGGSDYAGGGDGNDYILATGGEDTVFGGAGDDTIRGGAGQDMLAGDGGNDLIFAGAGDDAPVSGGAGDDTLYGEGGDDGLDGGDDNDRVFGGTGQDTLTGGNGDDTLYGQDGADSLDGGEGNDFMIGGAAFDTLTGGAGIDTLDGGVGNDSLDGGADNDRLSGRKGDDTLTGGDGDDTLSGGGEADSIDGGAGNDSISAGAGDDVAVIGGTGADTISGGSGNDNIDGGDGADVLRGDGGADTILGGAGADSLDGGGVGDVLDGGAGADTVSGGSGSDILIVAAGEGGDLLTGGTAQDRFVFETGSGTATITDFAIGLDIIDLSGTTATGIGDLTITYGAEATIDAGGGDIVTLIGISGGLSGSDFDFGQ